MKPVSLILIMLSLLNIPAYSQSVKVIKFDELTTMINQPNDTLYVVNFWATWCAPCVKELPQFEAVRRANAAKKMRVVLVSMDDKADLKTRVIPFVRNRHIQSAVVLLDESDLNTWVDKLAPEWSGALPMTLLVNAKQGVRQFIGKPVRPGELESLISQLER